MAGSSDCQHLAAEFVATLDHTDADLAAIALTTDSSFITAYSNDFGLRAFLPVRLTHWARQGMSCSDSTSGNSKNVVLAAQAAAAKDITVIGMTGNIGARFRLLRSGHICKRYYHAYSGMPYRAWPCHHGCG